MPENKHQSSKQPMSQRRITMEIRKYFELIHNGNTMNRNFWNAIKAVRRGNVQL